MYSAIIEKLSPLFDQIEFIGEGVTSKVFKARDRKTNSVVALKVLNPHLQADKISLERFKREIQITRSIQHPQVISIYDLVITHEPYYLVMEFVHGQSLKDYLRLNAPLSVPTVFSIITQLFDALALCHSKNVIHRDLKPQNVIIDPEGAVKILDFGIARMTALSDLTQTGTSLGSPEYMAPELYATNAYEPRSDLYAVGVMAFELLTGELPFQGDTLAVLFHKHLKEAVPALSGYRRDVPEWLQQVIEKLLAKKPHLRYQSADCVLRDLKAQRVMSNSLPVLGRRTCLACGEETPSGSVICLRCGQNGLATHNVGKYYITCDSQQDPDQIALFFAEYFGRVIECSGKSGTIFVTRVDEKYLNTFKQAAQRYGICFCGKSMLRLYLIRLACIFPGIPLVLNLLKGAVASIVAIGVDPAARSENIFRAVMSLLLAVVITYGVDKSFIYFKPALLRGGEDSEGRFADAEWLGRLSPLLREKRSEAMQHLVLQTLERFLLFEKHARSNSKAVKDQIRRILTAMLPVANYLSRHENAGKSEELAKLLREHASKTRSNGEVLELEEKITSIFNAEETLSLLANRFTDALALFNRLIGSTIVYDLKIDEPELELVRSQIGELVQEVEVWKRVQGDLSRGWAA